MGQVIGVWNVMTGFTIVVDLWQKGEITSFEHLPPKFVDPE